MNRNIGPNSEGNFHCGLCQEWKPKDQMKPRLNGAHGIEGKCKKCEAELQAQYRRLRESEPRMLRGRV